MLTLFKTKVMSLSKSISSSGIISIILMQAFLSGCSSSRELPVVEEVNLEKYSGKWYDITHLPQRFQAGCKCVTAEYTPDKNYVRVVNTCVNEDTDESRDVKGKAFPVKGSNNAKLKVQFFWPFKGDYYIIALEDDYSMAMVGAPNRKYLWILSRNKNPEQEKMDKYLELANNLGFDTSQLEYTDQSCGS
jgi:apolipoprotein D and lipocalin family protein